MAVLNLRNVPEELMRDLRKAAVDAGLGLHDYCRAVLARGVDMGLGQPEKMIFFRGSRGGGKTADLMHDFYRDSTLDPPAPPREAARPQLPAAPDGAVKVEIT